MRRRESKENVKLLKIILENNVFKIPHSSERIT